jgi:hypothetical protein
MSSTVRNIAIVVVLAAVVALVPGGGTTAAVVIQALSLGFLAALAWIASIMYRQHRSSLYLLGDRRRAALYGAIALLAVTLTATARLWATPAGSVAWLVLVAAGVYAAFAVVWSARKY